MDLIKASRKGDLETVEKLLSQNVNVNEMDETETTALGWAAHNGHLDVVKRLIPLSSDTNFALYLSAREEQNRVVNYVLSKEAGIYSKSVRELFRACYDGDIETFRNLLSRGYNKEILIMLLCMASSRGYLEMVKFLVGMKVNFHLNNERALEWAASQGKLEVVRYLIDLGADIRYGLIITSCKCGHLNVAKYLVNSGADIHVLNEAPLKWACEKGYLEIVKFLISRGATIKDSLSHASMGGHVDIIKYLLEKGADLHYGDEEALRFAAHEGHFEVVKFLIEAGANIHARDDSSLTEASAEGHFEVVKYLVSVGADIHIDNDYALRWAKNLEVVKHLVEAGADIHAHDDFALKLSFEKGNLDIVRFLISKGANRKVLTDSQQQLLAQETIRKFWRRYRIRKWARELLSKKANKGL